MPRKSPPPKKPASPLDPYQGKRDFKRTPEPAKGKRSKSGRSFVVQEHHARSLHYDFRLEMNGVLVSWAVPKGIPSEPVEKRLAVHVEDHPVAYGTFEGTIPAGNYGAGEVSIWDAGEWQPVDDDWEKQFKKGKLKFALKGKRLHGIYLLARMDKEPNWLFRKLRDDLPAKVRGKAPREKAAFVSPQLARVVPTVPGGADQIHETKYDGYRLLAVKNGSTVRLFTRNEHDWTNRFKGLAEALRDLSEADFVLDGEAVVFDDKGRSRFGDLQQALQAGDADKIVFMAFDLLHAGGENLRDLPLSERIARLAEIVPDGEGIIRRSKVWPAEEGAALFKDACRHGLEGIISKGANGRYIPGSRRDWTKSKCRARQEFVIAGYTPPKGSLTDFGALLIASHENGKLVPRGKVGTGFTTKDRARLLKIFKPLITRTEPFESSERGVVWVKPELVAEVEFAEITRDGLIRQGSFVALREDKAAPEVHLDGVQSSVKDPAGFKVKGITISHPDRLVYPDEGVTKGEVARYYERVGKWMLPFVANRPLAVLRAPEGISGQTFFQKSFPAHVPAGVQQKTLEDGSEVFQIKDVAGLVSLAQFGVIEFHPWGATMANSEKPDSLVWDLDPHPDVSWKEVLGAAFLLRDFLADRDLHPLVKTSGGKGLHVLLPIRRIHGWDLMKEFSKAVAAAVQAYNPKRFTITSSMAKRKGRIYIDWLRNGRGATCIAPWCLRARPGAEVSMPVTWEQLPEVSVAGFSIHEPSVTPEEWLHLEPATIRKDLLRELGVLKS